MDFPYYVQWNVKTTVIKDLLVLEHPKEKTAKTKGYLNYFTAGSTQTQFNYYITSDIGFLEIL